MSRRIDAELRRGVRAMYRRVVLKLSGESFADPALGYGIAGWRQDP